MLNKAKGRMLKTYGRWKRTGLELGWDEYYPTSSVYIPSKEILELRKHVSEFKER